LLRAEGLEEQVGYFGRQMSVDQAVAEFMQTSQFSDQSATKPSL
jgi:hypothetical protein